MVSTWALLDSTPRSTEYESWAVTARMPGTLLAAIATPRPVPQISSARSAVPAATCCGRLDPATLGCRVWPSASTPTSLTAATPGLLLEVLLEDLACSRSRRRPRRSRCAGAGRSQAVRHERSPSLRRWLSAGVGGECVSMACTISASEMAPGSGVPTLSLTVRAGATHAGQQVRGRGGGARSAASAAVRQASVESGAGIDGLGRASR